HHPHLHSFPTRRSSDLSSSGKKLRTSVCVKSLPAMGEVFQRLYTDKDVGFWIWRSAPFGIFILRLTPPSNGMARRKRTEFQCASERKSTRLNSSHSQIS